MKNKLFTLVMMLSFAIVLWSCGGNPAGLPTPNAPIPVNVITATPEKAVYFDKFPGTVTALMQVDIRAEAEGYLTGIFFKEGERVHKGQKLYEIDNRIYSASQSQAQANLRVAEANLDQAQKDADRYTYLNDHDAVAKQTLDHALTSLQNAKSQLAAARQDLVKTETDLNYTIVKAPCDGTIGISQVKTGNTVTKGQTILNTISSDNPMAVDFQVNEKQIQRFVRMQNEKNTDTSFSLLMPDNTPYYGRGHIMLMDRGVNPQTGTITIRLGFPNDSGFLRAGMSCLVRVRNQDTALQMMIPGRAIVEQMGEYFVYVAKDTLLPLAGPSVNPNAKAVSSMHAIQRKVSLGPNVADKVIIHGGIMEGEQVIVDGVQRLRDGADVAIGAPSAATKQKQ